MAQRAHPPRPWPSSSLARLGLVFALVIAALAAAGALGWRQVDGEVGARAQGEAARAVAAVSESLDQADTEFGPLALAGVRALLAEAARQGAPSLRPDPAGGAPILRLGGRDVNGHDGLVLGVAQRMGGVETLFTAGPGGVSAASTSLTQGGGAPLSAGERSRFVAPGTEAWTDLAAGRPYAGPVEVLGRYYYARFEPIRDRAGSLVGAAGAQHPLSDVDTTVRALAASPVFAHGFLAVLDRQGRVLFRSTTVSPPWLTRHAAALMRFLSAGGASGGATTQVSGSLSGYRLSRSPPGRDGLSVVAGLLPADLTVQALRVEGASLGAFAIVIILILALAWLLARRLTEALEAAQKSRAEAVEATAASEAAGAALRGELDRAAAYVESLLPPRLAPAERKGPVSADWLYRPSVALGGDAFGYDWLDETRFAVYLLDVCGHGVGAALLAVTVMNVIRTRTLAGADFRAPRTVLAGLNDAFPMDGQNGMYFTLWYGVYDTGARELTYASAGHHPALLAPPADPPSLLRGRGVPIGCFEAVTYAEFTATVPRGARLYLFSDGLFEVELARRDEMFTFEGFCNIIMEWRDAPRGRPLACVMEAVQSLQGKAQFDDDCALIELTFEAGPTVESAA